MSKPCHDERLREAVNDAGFGDTEIRRELSDLLLTCPGTGAWVWNLSANTVHWSQEVYRILDAPDFDNTLESFQNMVLPDDMEASMEVVSRALTTRKTFRTTFRVKTPKGELRRLLNAGRALYDESGKPKMVVGMVSDLEQDGERSGDYDNMVSELARTGEAPADRMRELRDHLWFVRSSQFRSPATAETDQWILSFLLERLLEPQSARVLAMRLLRKFDSAASVLSADRARLKEVEGIQEEHLELFEIAQYSMECVLYPRAEPLKFDQTDTLISYLRASHAYQAKEQLRVIFFDHAHHFLANEVMQEGTVDHTPVYAREIVKRALEVSATSIILVHNHPSGDPVPSQSDIELTARIAKLALGLGIEVQDHIILGRYGHTSLHGLGLI